MHRDVLMPPHFPPPGLALRGATPDDAPAAAALVRALSGPFLLSPDGQGADAFFAAMSAPALAGTMADARFDYRLLVATGGAVGMDGSGDTGARAPARVVAFGALRDDRHLFLLFVDTAHQRRGLARGLWHALRDAARERGHAGPFTVNASLNAVPVYGRFGFAPSGEVQRRDGVAFQPMTLPAR